MPSPPDSAAALTYLRTASLSGVELLVATNNSRIWRLFHERYCVCACSMAAILAAPPIGKVMPFK